MTEQDDNAPRIGTNYPLYQLAKALTAAETHPDPELRERAQKRVDRWTKVLFNVLGGSVDYGSRAPIKDTPDWVTLEVMTGGFATGAFVAGGPLLDHERELLAEISLESEGASRRALNAYFISDKGIERLQSALRTGCYDIKVPEEGALLVVAWLLQNGHGERARELLEEIALFLPELRFYPEPRALPRQVGAEVFLQAVAATKKSLEAIRPNEQLLAQREAIQIWIPLYDRLVAHFLETVDGEPPRLVARPNSSKSSRYEITGVWPCQIYPDGWEERGTKLLADIRSARERHRLSSKPVSSKSSLAELNDLLQKRLSKTGRLKGRDVGRVRLILARYITKRGLPGSPQMRDARELQAAEVSAALHRNIAELVIARLASYPQDGGINDLAPLAQPVTEAETKKSHIETGTTIPKAQQKKLQRCLIDSVDELIARNVITSGDVLAQVLPQVTSGVRAAGIVDPELRRLYASIYGAFRRRRSLLLLDLQKQVQIEELPWIAAIEQFRRSDQSTQSISEQTLIDMSVLAIGSFPHALIPNKLLQEIRALAKGARLDLPLVDELAADIFTGRFSQTFILAANNAAELLQGSIYETYYDIDYDAVLRLSDADRSGRGWFRRNRNGANTFAGLCETRAGVTYGGWNPVINGMIIEQQQILTSQNLAALFLSPDLRSELQDRLEELARRCFKWICTRQQVKVREWHARLIVLKNTAYAWRQMIFYLALLSDADVRRFLDWAEEHLAAQGIDFQSQFSPALLGLQLAADGRAANSRTADRRGAKIFLGWAKDKHWLLRAYEDS